MILRPYQERGVAEMRVAFSQGARRVLFVLPTGGGKTTVFSYITSTAAARGNRVCVLVHRQELVVQVSGSLAAKRTETRMTEVQGRETAKRADTETKAQNEALQRINKSFAQRNDAEETAPSPGRAPTNSQ